jgi:hypothetical protein
VTGIEAYNTSCRKLPAILADPGQVAGNLRAPIAAFDADTRDVIEKFDFDAQMGRLDRWVREEGGRTKEGERTTWPSAERTGGCRWTSACAPASYLEQTVGIGAPGE